MGTSQSDALVFLDASGDLAYKMIFPALQAMVKSGRLDCWNSMKISSSNSMEMSFRRKPQDEPQRGGVNSRKKGTSNEKKDRESLVVSERVKKGEMKLAEAAEVRMIPSKKRAKASRTSGSKTAGRERCGQLLQHDQRSALGELADHRTRPVCGNICQVTRLARYCGNRFE